MCGLWLDDPGAAAMTGVTELDIELMLRVKEAPILWIGAYSSARHWRVGKKRPAICSGLSAWK